MPRAGAITATLPRPRPLSYSCSHSCCRVGGRLAAPAPNILKQTPHPKRPSKKLPALVEAAARVFRPDDTRPLKVFFQDEARFGRMYDPVYCWAPKGSVPKCRCNGSRGNFKENVLAQSSGIILITSPKRDLHFERSKGGRGLAFPAVLPHTLEENSALMGLGSLLSYRSGFHVPEASSARLPKSGLLKRTAPSKTGPSVQTRIEPHAHWPQIPWAHFM